MQEDIIEGRDDAEGNNKELRDTGGGQNRREG